jgi:glycosyltransferase involved in cell wall biosynthesis
MPEPTVRAVRDAIQRLLDDPALRQRLGEEGRRTAQPYAWERRIDDLETFFHNVVEQQRRAPVPHARPDADAH